MTFFFRVVEIYSNSELWRVLSTLIRVSASSIRTDIDHVLLLCRRASDLIESIAQHLDRCIEVDLRRLDSIRYERLNVLLIQNLECLDTMIRFSADLRISSLHPVAVIANTSVKRLQQFIWSAPLSWENDSDEKTFCLKSISDVNRSLDKNCMIVVTYLCSS